MKNCDEDTVDGSKFYGELEKKIGSLTSTQLAGKRRRHLGTGCGRFKKHFIPIYAMKRSGEKRFIEMSSILRRKKKMNLFPAGARCRL